MAIPLARPNSQKVIQKFKDQTQKYYEGWRNAEKVVEKKSKLYNYSIDLLVGSIKEKQSLKKPDVIEREVRVPYEVVKRIPFEVEVEVPVDREIIKEVPVEVVREVIREVEIPVEKLVKVPVEVIKEIPIERIKKVEVIKEVPVEVEVKVEKFIEVPVEVTKEVIVKEFIGHSKWFYTAFYLLSMTSFVQTLWLICF